MKPFYQTHFGKLFLGDCLDIVKEVPNNSVDLIITSPPYADSRDYTYGGVPPDQYSEWFLPRSKEFFRVLKDDGTFILNIKEKVVDCERHTYVIKLILDLKEQGWLWTEEFIWCKKNCYPGKWPNRFRDAWERCLQFNKIKKFNMYQDSVKIPIGDLAEKRLTNLKENDINRRNPGTKSKFVRNLSNWQNRKMVYPDNVLYLSTECGNKSHSAVFPKALPEWFIKLFTKGKDVVLDPFMGSGTVAEVCEDLNRKWIGVEYKKDHCEIIKERLKKTNNNICVGDLF